MACHAHKTFAWETEMKPKQLLTDLFVGLAIGTLVLFLGEFALSAYKINSYRSVLSATNPDYDQIYSFLLLMLGSSSFSLFGALASLGKIQVSLMLLIVALILKIGLLASPSFYESELIGEFFNGVMPNLIAGGILDAFFISRIFYKKIASN